MKTATDQQNGIAELHRPTAANVFNINYVILSHKTAPHTF